MSGSMKKDGYFESKRLKLPRTSTTAELHRPLTLSESIRILNRCAFHINVPISRILLNTDAGRETTNVHTTNLPKKNKKKKREGKKRHVLPTPSMMSLYLISLPFFPRGGRVSLHRARPKFPIEHSNLRHMKRSNLPFDLFLFV